MSKANLYRPDIDGLRAVAVMSVILFHYGLFGLSGGFAGVDVFFVISGYLITAQLVAELARPSLGLGTLLGNFYARRIRRIMPALIVVLITTCVAGWFVIIPIDYANMGASAAMSAIGFGNIYFYFHTGYFDRAAELQPLLHLWSLGVEEQFYFLWPGLLYVLFRLTQSRRALIVASLATLIVCSFAASSYMSAVNPKAAFYLPFFRAWELGAGALVAFCPSVTRRWLSEVMGAIGIGLIGYTVLTLAGAEVSLSFSMLPAVIGAVLLIYPRQQSTIAQALGFAPVRYIGLISYSLYLWHWPVLVFYRMLDVEAHPSAAAASLLFLISLALSALSYRFIEQPARRQSFRRSVLMTAAAIAVVMIIGLGLKFSSGVPSRLTASAKHFADEANDFSPRRPQCHRSDSFNPPLSKSCLYGDRQKTPTIAVWGDSHAVEIGQALGDIAAKRAASLVALTYSSCPPTLNYRSPFVTGCEAFDRSVVDFLRGSPSIRTVVITAYYEAYLKEANSPGFKTGVEQAVVALTAAGKRVVIIASNPETGYSIPQEATRLAMKSAEPVISLPMDQHRASAAEAREMIDRLAATHPSVTIVDPARTLCSDRVCPMVAGGRTMLFDADHLTLTAARKVADAMAGTVFGSMMAEPLSAPTQSRLASTPK